MTAKILVLSFDRVPGIHGAGQHLAQLVPALAELADVDALSIKQDDLAHIQRLGAARMMRVPTPGASATDWIAAFQRALHRQLDSEVYDLVLCSDVLSAHAASSHPSMKSIPMIVEMFELASQTYCPRHGIAEDMQLNNLLQRQEKTALVLSQQVVVHGPQGLAAAQAQEVDPQRITQLPLAVDRRMFARPSIEVPADPKACVIGLVADPFTSANLEPVLHAWASLPKRLQLLVLHDGPIDASMQALADRAGLGERLRFEPSQTPEQLAAVLGKSDVLVSWNGWTQANQGPIGLPLVIYNALLRGRPALFSSRVDTDLPLQLAQLRFNTGDAEGLTTRLIELASSSALRTRLALRGAEAVTDQVNWEEYRDGMLELISRLTGQNLSPIDRPSDLDPSVPAAETPKAHLETSQPTPIVPHPPPDMAGEEPTPTNVPAPITLGLADDLDVAGEDQWVHDTIATPMQPEHQPTTPISETGSDSFPGLRSMSLLDVVPEGDPTDQETEIRARNEGPTPPLGSTEATERLEITNDIADRLQRIAAEADRLRQPSRQEHPQPPNVPDQVHVQQSATDPYGAGLSDEVTDRDRLAEDSVGTETGDTDPARPSGKPVKN